MIYVIIFLLLFFLGMQSPKGKNLEEKLGLSTLPSVSVLLILLVGLGSSYNDLFLFEDKLIGLTWGLQLNSSHLIGYIVLLCHIILMHKKELDSNFYAKFSIPVLLSVAACISTTPFLSSIILIIAMFSFRVGPSKLFMLHVYPLFVLLTQLVDLAQLGSIYFISSTSGSILETEMFVVCLSFLTLLITTGTIINESKNENKIFLIFIVPLVILQNTLAVNFSSGELNDLIKAFFYLSYTALVLWGVLKKVKRAAVSNLFAKIILLTMLMSVFFLDPSKVFTVLVIQVATMMLFDILGTERDLTHAFDHSLRFLAYISAGAIIPWFILEEISSVWMPGEVNLYSLSSFCLYYLTINLSLVKLTSGLKINFSKDVLFNFKLPKRYIQSFVLLLLFAVTLVVLVKHRDLSTIHLALFLPLLFFSLTQYLVIIFRSDFLQRFMSAVQVRDLGFVFNTELLVERTGGAIGCFIHFITFSYFSVRGLVSSLFSYVSMVSYELIQILIRQKISMAILIWVLLFALMSRGTIS